jgi:hypothetical protein
MRPLALDDLFPLEEFVAQRRSLFAAHVRYLDRYRRVRVGPRLTLVFENRQTMRFRLQEVLRVARLSDPVRVQQELDVYNRLLPSRGRLQAALLVEVNEDEDLNAVLAPWRAFRGEQLRLRLGGAAVPAELVTHRAEDLAVGAAHWVQFALDDNACRRLADFRRPAHFECVLREYQHESSPLSDDVRQSLLDDLALPDGGE